MQSKELVAKITELTGAVKAKRNALGALEEDYRRALIDALNGGGSEAAKRRQTLKSDVRDLRDELEILEDCLKGAREALTAALREEQRQKVTACLDEAKSLADQRQKLTAEADRHISALAAVLTRSEKLAEAMEAARNRAPFERGVRNFCPALAAVERAQRLQKVLAMAFPETLRDALAPGWQMRRWEPTALAAEESQAQANFLQNFETEVNHGKR
jgi:hypothetical protein